MSNRSSNSSGSGFELKLSPALLVLCVLTWGLAVLALWYCAAPLPLQLICLALLLHILRDQRLRWRVPAACRLDYRGGCWILQTADGASLQLVLQSGAVLGRYFAVLPFSSREIPDSLTLVLGWDSFEPQHWRRLRRAVLENIRAGDPVPG